MATYVHTHFTYTFNTPAYGGWRRHGKNDESEEQQSYGQRQSGYGQEDSNEGMVVGDGRYVSGLMMNS